MDLSVVVINWKSGRYLSRLLDSLVPLAAEVEDIIVVDNASGEPPPAALSQMANAQWVDSSRNLGFAGAANLGVGRARSRFVMLLNPDVKLLAESARNLYQEMLRLPRAGVVCGPLVDEDGTPQAFQLRPLPTPGRVLLEVLFLKRLLGRSPATRARISESPIPVEQPAAAYWLIRKQAWEDLEGMDEGFYPAWFEDVDFCRRALDSGWRIIYFPGCPAHHQGGVSLEILGKQNFYRIYYRNLLLYLKKHHPQAYPWLWLPVQLGKLARIVAQSFVGRPSRPLF